MKALALIAMLGGCLILSETTRSERIVSKHVGRQVPGPAGLFGFDAFVDGTAIRVRAMAPRECRRERYAIADVTLGKGASFEVLDSRPVPPEAAIVYALVSIVTVPVSGLITAFVVGSSEDETRRERIQLPSDTALCPVYAAGMPVAVFMPSGAVVHVVTDKYGGATVSVPASELSGHVTVRVGDLGARVLAYSGARKSP